MARDCFISSGAVNAYSLRRAIEQLGHRAYVLDGVDCAYPFERGTPRPGDCVFFTEEATLSSYAGRTDLHMWPRSPSWDWSDKLAFAHRVRRAEERVVDTWAATGDAPPAGYPFVLKGRRSWVGGRRAPRGFLIASPRELEARLAELRAQGWRLDDLIGQRYLPDGVRNSVSTCGFFEHADGAAAPIIATQKLLAPAGGLGGAAAVVRTLPDDHGLIDRTRRLLQALRYAGPFELEFLRDERTGEFEVLELNPRFWMQHALFIDLHDNAVVRRYLGEPTPAIDPRREAAWVSGAALAAAVVTPWRRYSRALLATLARLGLAGTHVLIEPPLPLSLRVLLTRATRRYARS